MGEARGTTIAGPVTRALNRFWVRTGALAGVAVTLAAMAASLAPAAEDPPVGVDAPWLALVVAVAYAALTVQPLVHTDRGRRTSVDAGAVAAMVGLVVLPAGPFIGAMMAGHLVGWAWYRAREERMPLLSAMGGRKLVGNVVVNLAHAGSALLVHTWVCEAIVALPTAVCAGVAVTVAEGVSLIGLTTLIGEQPVQVVRRQVGTVLRSPAPWVVLVVGGLLVTQADDAVAVAAWLGAAVVCLSVLGRHHVGLHDELEQHRALLDVARALPTLSDRASVERLLLDRARVVAHAGSATLEAGPPAGDSFGVPLDDQGRRWLAVHDRLQEGETFRPAEQETLRGLATLGQLALRTVALTEDLQHAASHDQLTGLLSRRGLQDRWGQAVARARRHGRSLGVVYVDLDGFKQVNDRRGHVAGDAVLRAAARRLRAVARDSDLVCRMGGDEFLLVAEDVADAAALDALVARVRGALGPRPDHGAAAIAASVGAARLPEDGTTLDEVVRVADAAMYRDKRR